MLGAVTRNLKASFPNWPCAGCCVAEAETFPDFSSISGQKPMFWEVSRLMLPQIRLRQTSTNPFAVGGGSAEFWPKMVEIKTEPRELAEVDPGEPRPTALDLS